MSRPVAGYAVAAATADPPTALLAGPPEAIDMATQVATERIDIADLRGSGRFRAQLVPPEGTVLSGRNSSVAVSVVLTPRPGGGAPGAAGTTADTSAAPAPAPAPETTEGSPATETSPEVDAAAGSPPAVPAQPRALGRDASGNPAAGGAAGDHRARSDHAPAVAPPGDQPARRRRDNPMH